MEFPNEKFNWQFFNEGMTACKRKGIEMEPKWNHLNATEDYEAIIMIKSWHSNIYKQQF